MRSSTLQYFLQQVCFIALAISPTVVASDNGGGSGYSEQKYPAPTQSLFVPLPEVDLYKDIFKKISTKAKAPITSMISLSVSADETIIYYDHWEDGYDPWVGKFATGMKKKQSSTEIWGDGDISNGCAPIKDDSNRIRPCTKNSDDILKAGRVIILEDVVPIHRQSWGNDKQTPYVRNKKERRYDGGDLIQATLPVAMTRAAYPSYPGSLMAGAVEVIEEDNWGTQFVSPIGTGIKRNKDVDGKSLNTGGYELSTLAVMAGSDDTVVRVNNKNVKSLKDGKLNKGQSIFVSVKQGDTITTTQPVQVHLITGDINSSYELRWYSLAPLEQWDTEAYAPVGDSKGQTRVTVYNPNDKAIVVEMETTGGTKRTFNVPSEKHAVSPVVPDHKAAKFSSTEKFFAFSSTDTLGNGKRSSDGDIYDWGYPLLGKEQLSPQIIVGLGYGCKENRCDSKGERSVVWVTPVEDADIYVDFNNNGKPDKKIKTRRLQSVQLTDSDRDMSGASIWATERNSGMDGEPVKIAAAWGQTAKNSYSGDKRAMDLGTVVVPFRGTRSSCSVELLKDHDKSKQISPGDLVQQQIEVINVGQIPLKKNTLAVEIPTGDTVVVTGELGGRGKRQTYSVNYTVPDGYDADRLGETCKLVPYEAPPSVAPSQSPSNDPSSAPSKMPSASPSQAPSSGPSQSPSQSPSNDPSSSPSKTPSASPSQAPSSGPSQSPSQSPSNDPSSSPSKTPSASPSQAPSSGPSQSPSQSPSNDPSTAPSKTPSASPSQAPSSGPSQSPSQSPSNDPSSAPSKTPSASPSQAPSSGPSQSPSQSPSNDPSSAPSKTPSASPSQAPSSGPSRSPSQSPSQSPSNSPSSTPSKTPSTSPSSLPSGIPSASPSESPSLASPSGSPSSVPSSSPSSDPSTSPSKSPIGSPSASPSSNPSGAPSTSPSGSPSLASPSGSPSGIPSSSPSSYPSASPSKSPIGSPSASPSSNPSGTPSTSPSRSPSIAPSGSPSGIPSSSASFDPSASPSKSTSGSPSVSPSSNPSGSPSASPTRSSAVPSDSPSASPSGFPSSTPVPSPDATASQAPSASPSSSTAPTISPRNKILKTPAPSPDTTAAPSPAPTPKGSSSGDPHFKTWNGDKYDYHGECDLVLVDHPSFDGGRGLRVHIRTTRIKYFSFIEKVALQIGSDVLEFDNDVENFLINGKKVEANCKHHKTMFAGFMIRRDKKAISVRLSNNMKGGAKIDFHTRKNGFPAVILDAAHTDMFKGSLGLLGEWKTGRKVARDGKSEVLGINGPGDDATSFALEWQVRDTEPMLFQEPRFPQYPTKCSPPKKMPGNRLGMSKARKEAEEACSHWKEDQQDCIFDVLATADVTVAHEGHIIHIE